MKRFRLEDQKTALRKRMREVLKNIPSTLRREKSGKICSRICKSEIFQKANCVMAYASLPNEAATFSIIREALTLKKTVCLPVAESKRKTMNARQIRSLRDLRRGSFGILEPDVRKTKKQDLRKIDLVLVPGLGFDRKGRRLGRGKGYYDRFLRKIKSAYFVGLAFREQMLRNIPAAAHDIKMHRVITG